MADLKDHMTQCKDAYLSEDHSHTSVNNVWVKFKIDFVEAIALIGGLGLDAYLLLGPSWLNLRLSLALAICES